jgi:hypothetical protein
MDLASILDNEFVLAEEDYLPQVEFSTEAQEDSEDYLPLETQEEFSTEAQEDIFEDSEAVFEDSVTPINTIGIEFREEDLEEGSRVSDFYDATCGCKLGVNKTACSTTLTTIEFIEFRDNCKQYSRGELDALLLGQIHSQFQAMNRVV